MKVDITSSSVCESIIIVDNEGGISTSPRLQANVERIDFELSGSKYQITQIGSTTLTPTVKTGATGFVFSESNKKVTVLGASDATLYEASTNNKTVLVKVDIKNATITVFE